MLLSVLSKEEKFYFIDLLKKVLVVDGPTNEFEEHVQSIFQAELGKDMERYRKSSLTTEKLIQYFAEKSKPTKCIVYYNLFAASLIDEFYSVEEHLLLEQIQQALNIPNKTRIELCKAVYAERDLREKVKRIVHE